MRLDKSNKKNGFLRYQFSSQDEKMKSLEQKLARKLNFKIYLIPNLLLITDLLLFLFHSSLKMIKFISLILREIIKKRLILLG